MNRDNPRKDEDEQRLLVNSFAANSDRYKGFSSCWRFTGSPPQLASFAFCLASAPSYTSSLIFAAPTNIKNICENSKSGRWIIKRLGQCAEVTLKSRMIGLIRELLPLSFAGLAGARCRVPRLCQDQFHTFTMRSHYTLALPRKYDLVATKQIAMQYQSLLQMVYVRREHLSRLATIYA